MRISVIDLAGRDDENSRLTVEGHPMTRIALIVCALLAALASLARADDFVIFNSGNPFGLDICPHDGSLSNATVKCHSNVLLFNRGTSELYRCSARIEVNFNNDKMIGSSKFVESECIKRVQVFTDKGDKYSILMDQSRSPSQPFGEEWTQAFWVTRNNPPGIRVCFYVLANPVGCNDVVVKDR
jgi:hypothetical protein